jgi:hypothetical protein
MEALGCHIYYPSMCLTSYYPGKFTYQTVEKGITTYLSEKNKKYWLIFPLHVGRYTLRNKPHAEKEVEDLK